MPTAQGGDSEKVVAKGLFIVGGTVKEVITASEPQTVRDHLSSLLQVKNLVVLLGSGASFHLGSPKTRDLSNQQVLGLIRDAGDQPTPEDSALLDTINPTDNGDLEKLLNGLQLAASLAVQAGQDAVSLGSGSEAKSYPREEVDGLRQRINRALAEACRLPKEGRKLDMPFDVDPLLAHRTFLSRIVRSRRANLPRPRVFTTNYDLVIEGALDELGYPYIDGFSGTATDVSEPSDDELRQQYDLLVEQQEGMEEAEEIPPFEEIRDQFAEQAVSEERNAATQGLLEELQEQGDVTIHV